MLFLPGMISYEQIERLGKEPFLGRKMREWLASFWKISLMFSRHEMLIDHTSKLIHSYEGLGCLSIYKSSYSNYQSYDNTNLIKSDKKCIANGEPFTPKRQSL